MYQIYRYTECKKYNVSEMLSKVYSGVQAKKYDKNKSTLLTIFVRLKKSNTTAVLYYRL